jgi:hypothetical protein
VFNSRSQYPPVRVGEFAIFSRSYTADEISSAFSGPWIEEGWKDSIRHYYRPLCILGYSWLYDAFGSDVPSLYRIRLMFSLLRLVLFFFLLYLLTGRSRFPAFLGTLMYGLSFKTYDEVVVFQCWPDIAVTTLVFACILLFLFFADDGSSGYGRILCGAGIAALMCLGLGVKENAVFITPALAAWLFIDKSWADSRVRPGEGLKAFLRPRHLLLFAVLAAVTAGYFLVRYRALGPAYVVKNSYETRYNDAWIVWLNLLNTFALFPATYAQEHVPVLNRYTVLSHLNAALFIGLSAWVLRSKSPPYAKKAILFSLCLVVINGFFSAQLIRPRFTSVGNLGAFTVVVTAGHHLLRSLFQACRSFGTRTAVVVCVALFLILYAAANVRNLVMRQSPVTVRRYASPVPLRLQ